LQSSHRTMLLTSSKNFRPQNTMSQGGDTGELCGIFWVDCRQVLGKVAP
jgi:hypothetical protein